MNVHKLHQRMRVVVDRFGYKRMRAVEPSTPRVRKHRAKKKEKNEIEEREERAKIDLLIEEHPGWKFNWFEALKIREKEIVNGWTDEGDKPRGIYEIFRDSILEQTKRPNAVSEP